MPRLSGTSHLSVTKPKPTHLAYHCTYLVLCPVLEAGWWLKTWEVEKGRRMGKQSGEKGPQVKGWLSGAAMLDARAEAQHLLSSISPVPKYREV